MSEPVTWDEVRMVISQLNKTLDQVQAQLKDNGQYPAFNDLFDLFGKKP